MPRLSYSNESISNQYAGDDCDLVLCEEGTSGETLRRAHQPCWRKCLTVPELQLFLGTILLMGVHVLPTIESY